MKPQNIKTVVCTIAVVVTGSIALSAPDPTVVNQTFAGKYRKPVKLAIAKPAPTREYANVSAVLQSLPKDSAMRSKYPSLRPHIKKWPSQREPEEMLNVKIDNAWICAVKYEHGGTAHNDFHVILSNSPTKPFTSVMNMEVAALPTTPTADSARLKGVRQTFLSFFQSTPPSGAFRAVTPPIHVAVEGSLYFDGEHTAGIRGHLGRSRRRFGKYIPPQN